MNTNVKASIAALIGTAAVGAIAVLLLTQQQSQTKLREATEALKHQTEQTDKLVAENERLSNAVVRATTPAAADPSPTKEQLREVLKLRGEVGRLRQEQASDAAAQKTNSASPLSSITSDPEMMKVIRTQQKMGMSMIYKDFVKKAGIPAEQAEKLQDLLADHVMDNIDRISSVLREGKTGGDLDQVFKEQEAALQAKVQALLGPDAFPKYEDYTRNLASYLTSQQFKAMMSGDKDAKEKQSKQLYQVMQEETQAALTRAGLDPDFQTVPTLNFRNFASEEIADQNLKLLDGIYEQVSQRAASFLSAEDLQKFSEFRTNAINGNRMGLAVNRKMMAPAKKL